MVDELQELSHKNGDEASRFGETLQIEALGVPDVLTYWRDYAANRAASVGERYGLSGDGAGSVLFWHSSERCVPQLQTGDRMRIETSCGVKIEDNH